MMSGGGGPEGGAGAETTPIFAISHQSTALSGTTYPIYYGADLASSANMTPVTSVMGAEGGGNLWNWSHQTVGGYAGRNFMRYDEWQDVDHDPQTGFTFDPAVVAPAGGWVALAQSAPIYCRFRIRVNAPLTLGAVTAGQIKWFIFGGPGISGERRMLLSFERANHYGVGADVDGIALKACAGVSGNYAVALIPVGVWTHVQVAWQYSDAGSPYMRIYIDNNVIGSPDAEHTAFTADSMGGVWSAIEGWTGCNWGNNVATNAVTGDNAQFDVMDFEVDDEFDAAWAA